MPEEAEIGEVGVDKLHEEAHEHAHHNKERAPWLRWLALSTAGFAVLAAIAALLSGHFANEGLLAMTESTLTMAKASDTWGEYQANSIKSHAMTEHAELLTLLKADDKAIDDAKKESSEKKAEKEKLGAEAKKLMEEQQSLEKESKTNLSHHHDFAYVVTTLQVAIGISAVAALTEKKSAWYLGLILGLVGVGLFVFGLIRLKGG